MAGATTSGSPVRHRIVLQEPLDPAALQGGVPILVAAFADGGAFLEALAAERGAAGELVVCTRAAPARGLAMVLEITWPGLPNHVFLRVTAHHRWFGGNLILRIDADERGKRDYLVRVAGGRAGVLHLRAHRRFCVRLPLRWRRFGDDRTLHAGVAEDLSSGGVLIACRAPSPVPGDRVVVRLHAEDIAQELVLTGVVVHRTRRGSGDWAFGVRFEYRSGREQRTLRSLLRVFGSRGVVLVDPSL
jgi:hypothetical protein